MRKWILIGIVSGIVLTAGAFNLHQILRDRIISSEFKQFAEEKVGQLLSSSVKIGKIQFRFFKQISLSGLQIQQKDSEEPVLIGVQKIIVRYNFWNLLKNQFKSPAAILLDSPKFQLKPGQPFWASVIPAVMRPESRFFSRMELDGGEIEVPIPFIDEKLRITEIYGRSSWVSGQLRLDFRSKVGGFLEGALTVNGYLTPKPDSGSLKIYLKDINWRSSDGIPVKNLRGTIELAGSELRIHSVSFNFRGIPCRLSGLVSDIFSANPTYSLSWQLVDEEKIFALSTEMNFGQQVVSGNLLAYGMLYKFKGRVASDANSVRLDDLVFQNGYQAGGELNLREGKFRMAAERAEQRFSADVNFKNFLIDLDLNMTHLKVAGHDIATLAKLKLEPVEEAWSAGRHHFQGTIETAYFIFNYQPLQDFSAGFRISPSGVESLAARWSGISQLTGSISFSNPPVSDLTLVINRFDLSNFRRLGVHEMPAALGGELEGKIKISGLLHTPSVEGRMSIQNGKVSDFDYELASLYFNGQYPRLNFTDSKITKKGKTYLLRGDIDFKLDNIVKNIRVLSNDQMVIWRGWNLKKDAEGQDLAGPSSTGSAPAPGFKPYRLPGYSEVELEYSFKKGKSLSVVAEDDEEGKRFVGVGPKLRF